MVRKPVWSVLIVEDDLKVQTLLELCFLKEQIFSVQKARSIIKAKTILKRKHIDLAIVDLMLLDGYGLELCKYIKSESSLSGVKVIVITKKSDIEMRINSFETGADDYLPKPFFPEELLVRAKRLLGFFTTTSSNILKYNELILDRYSCELNFKNIRILLSQNESILLELMMKSGEYVDFKKANSYFLSQGKFTLTEQAFRVGIKRLRDKLDAALGMKIIRNRHGYGYFIAI